MANEKVTVFDPDSPRVDSQYRIINAWHSGVICPDVAENRPPYAYDQAVQCVQPGAVSAGLEYGPFMNDRDNKSQSDSKSGPALHPEYFEIRGNSRNGTYQIYNPSTQRYVNVSSEGEPRYKLRLEQTAKQDWHFLLVPGTAYYQIVPTYDHNRAVGLLALYGWDTHLGLDDRLPGVDRGWYFIPVQQHGQA